MADSRNSELKFFLPLTLTSLVILLYCNCTVHKVIAIFGIEFPASSLLYPLSYVIGDIVAEVYGYNYSRKLLWNILFFQHIFSFATGGITFYPYHSSPETQTALEAIFGYKILTITLYSSLSILVGAFLNAYLMSKMKIAMHGKRFWIRSLLSSGIGDFMAALTGYIIIFWNEKTILKICQISINAWAYEMIVVALLTFPATIVLRYIKSKEKIDVYDKNINYNPFIFWSTSPQKA